jgi:hypothetical protein
MAQCGGLPSPRVRNQPCPHRYQLRGCRRVLVCTLQDAHIDMDRQLVRSLGTSVGLWSDLGLRSCRVAISVDRVRSVEEDGLTTSELHRGVYKGLVYIDRFTLSSCKSLSSIWNKQQFRRPAYIAEASTAATVKKLLCTFRLLYFWA